MTDSKQTLLQRLRRWLQRYNRGTTPNNPGADRSPRLAYPPSISPNAQIHRDALLAGRIAAIQIDAGASVGRFAVLDSYDDGTIAIGAGTVICAFSMLLAHKEGRISIGRNSSINEFCMIYGHGGLTIGDNVRIATHTVIVPANHQFERLDQAIAEQGLEKKGVTIEDDVWIGASVVILDGVHIGRGAVIGAGAVVTADVQPFTVVAGVPAREIGCRNGPRRE